MTDLLQPLAKSPGLPRYVAELTALLDTEQQRRQRFYAEMREDQKTEFINGEVIMHSPAKYRHIACVGHLYNLLSNYSARHGLGFVSAEKLLISLSRNDYEPDVAFFRREIAAHFAPDQMQFPAPDLVVEVLSPSTETVDRQIKFEDYAAHGVQEYWIVDPEREVLEQNILCAGRYELRVKADSGEIKCQALTGLIFPVRAIFDSGVNQATVRALLGEAG